MDEPKKLTEEDILDKVKKFRENAIAGSANLFDRMRKAEDFKIGYQWDPAVKADNESKGKFCLTIPIIKPSIKQVVGTETQNPKDFKVRNLKGGSATVAKVLTALAKHATDSEQVLFERTQRFEAGLSSGVGVMGFFIDKSEDPRHGNLRIEKLNEFEVCFDPNCKVYDPNTPKVGCQYIIWEPWVIKEEVEAEYPDKKDELQTTGQSKATGMVMGAITSIIEWVVGANLERASTFGNMERTEVRELEKYRYQVLHTFWKEPKRCILLYDSRKSEIDSILLKKDDKIARAKKMAERWPDVFSYDEVVRPVMHHTIRVGDLFLEDRVDELRGCDMFQLVPYYPSFDNGYKAGMSEDGIGIQEEINYSRSQTLNIIKQLPNTGWIADKYIGTYKEFLEAHGGEDGIVLDKSKAPGLEKIDPNVYPGGFDRFTEQGLEHMKMVLNVRTEDPTTAKDRVMGAIALKQQAALTGLASLFRNHDYSMSIEGNLLIEIIRNNDIYSEDEIRAVVDEEDLIDTELLSQARQMIIKQFEVAGHPIPEQPMQPDMNVLQKFAPEIQQAAMNQYQQEVEVFSQLMAQIDEAARPIAEQLLFEELKNIKKGKYNTKVTLSPMAPTFRIAKMAELLEINKTLREGGEYGIDRESLIEASDIDNKEEVIERGKRQMAQMAVK